MRIYIFSILLIICTHIKSQNNVLAKQLESTHSVIIRLNNKNNSIRKVEFILPLDITKVIDTDVKYSTSYYYYSSRGEYDAGAILYADTIEKKGTLYQGDKRRFFKRNTSENYILYVPYLFKEDSPEQCLFTDYLKKMQATGKDTLHIGTISELKERDPKVLKILEGDSIFLSYRIDRYFYTYPMAVEVK